MLGVRLRHAQRLLFLVSVVSHDFEMSQRKPSMISTWFPGPQIPPNTLPLQTATHKHTIISKVQMCVNVCFCYSSSESRVRRPEHTSLFVAVQVSVSDVTRKYKHKLSPAVRVCVQLHGQLQLV